MSSLSASVVSLKELLLGELLLPPAAPVWAFLCARSTQQTHKRQAGSLLAPAAMVGGVSFTASPVSQSEQRKDLQGFFCCSSVARRLPGLVTAVAPPHHNQGLHHQIQLLPARQQELVSGSNANTHSTTMRQSEFQVFNLILV